VQALKTHSFEGALKTFTQLMDARKSRFSPNTLDPLCVNYTRHLMCFFGRNGSIQRSPHPWHRLSLKFGIFNLW